MGKNKIPDRWLDYQPLGQCISGTKIVAFKVPLKPNLCRYLPENDWFTPSMLLERQPGLKTVIDLTNTHRYYNGLEEFGTKGIDHIKIQVEGKGRIPNNSQLQRFFNAIDLHMEKYADTTDALVGVHCTHGLNRTGYFVCRWMVDRMKLNPEDAIGRFNEARGHNIERQFLLDHLKLKDLATLPPNSHQDSTTTNSARPFLKRKYESVSPLGDPLYDEPGTSGTRYRQNHRYRGRRSHTNGARGYKYNGSDRSRWRNNEDRPSRADLDTNWRSREGGGEEMAREDRFRHFGGGKKNHLNNKRDI